DDDLRRWTALQRLLGRLRNQIAGDGAGRDGDLLDVIPRRQRLADFRQIAAQERLAAAHDDKQQVAEGVEGFLKLVERELVLLVLAQLLPIEAGAAERVAVVRQPDDEIDRLHPALVDEIAEVAEFV